MNLKKAMIVLLFTICIIVIFPVYNMANNEDNKTKAEGIYKIAVGINSQKAVCVSDSIENVYINDYRK